MRKEAGRPTLACCSPRRARGLQRDAGLGATGASRERPGRGLGQRRFGNPYKGIDPNAPACKLLTQAEVEQALTQTLKPRPARRRPRQECHYVNAAGSG